MPALATNLNAGTLVHLSTTPGGIIYFTFIVCKIKIILRDFNAIYFVMLIVFYDVTDLCVYAKCTQLKGETPCVGSVAGLFSEWLAGYLNLCTSCLQTVLQQLHCIISNLLSFCQRILSNNVIMTCKLNYCFRFKIYISCIVKYNVISEFCNA